RCGDFLGSREAPRGFVHAASVLEHMTAEGVGRCELEGDALNLATAGGAAEELVESSLAVVEVAHEGLRARQVREGQGAELLVAALAGKSNVRSRVLQELGDVTVREP